MEAALSPAQQQQLAQLKQQQKGRHLLQGPKTQAQIQEIHDIDQGACAKPPVPALQPRPILTRLRLAPHSQRRASLPVRALAADTRGPQPARAAPGC